MYGVVHRISYIIFSGYAQDFICGFRVLPLEFRIRITTRIPEGFLDHHPDFGNGFRGLPLGFRMKPVSGAGIIYRVLVQSAVGKVVLRVQNLIYPLLPYNFHAFLPLPRPKLRDHQNLPEILGPEEFSCLLQGLFS